MLKLQQWLFKLITEPLLPLLRDSCCCVLAGVFSFVLYAVATEAH